MAIRQATETKKRTMFTRIFGTKNPSPSQNLNSSQRQSHVFQSVDGLNTQTLSTQYESVTAQQQKVVQKKVKLKKKQGAPVISNRKNFWTKSSPV